MNVRVVRSQGGTGRYAGHIVRPERKAYNIISEEQKARYWRQFERRRTRWYGAMARLTAKQFKAELKEVLSAIDGAEPAQIEALASKVIRGRRPEWLKFLQTTYLAIGEDFAPAVAASFKSAGVPELKADEDPWMRLLLDWISKNAGVKITQIESTTLDMIRRQLSKGMAAGESVPQISQRIEQIYGRNVSTRSALIARTEVIGASNAASYMGAKSTGLILNKKWLSSRDGRVRDDHRASHGGDGQEVGMDEPFVIGGEYLMWPGATSLGVSGAQTVNCRCTITYSKA